MVPMYPHDGNKQENLRFKNKPDAPANARSTEALSWAKLA